MSLGLSISQVATYPTQRGYYIAKTPIAADMGWLHWFGNDMGKSRNKKWPDSGFRLAYPREQGAPVHPYDVMAGDTKQQAIAYFKYLKNKGIPEKEMRKDPAYWEQFWKRIDE